MHTKQGRDKSHSNTLESNSVMATVQVLTKNRMILNNLSLLTQNYRFHVNHERFVYNLSYKFLAICL